jgi:predicted N-acetyltransferase YhbS
LSYDLTLLNKNVNRSDFDCGDERLNKFLKETALDHQRKGVSKTYVLLEDGKLIAYLTIVVGSAQVTESPAEMTKGLTKHFPFPVLTLARLGVAKTKQASGLGKALVKQCLKLAIAVDQLVGLRAVIVDVQTEEMGSYYEKFDFQRYPGDQLKLFVMMSKVTDAYKGSSKLEGIPAATLELALPIEDNS